MIAALRWFAVIAWMALIFYLSSIPAIDIPPGPQAASVAVHLLEFFVLALLLSWAINGGLKNGLHPSSLISAFIVAVFYGVLDELHQLYVPGRVTDMMDILVDAVGALIGVLVASLLGTVLQRKRSADVIE